MCSAEDVAALAVGVARTAIMLTMNNALKHTAIDLFRGLLKCIVFAVFARGVLFKYLSLPNLIAPYSAGSILLLFENSSTLTCKMPCGICEAQLTKHVKTQICSRISCSASFIHTFRPRTCGITQVLYASGYNGF